MRFSMPVITFIRPDGNSIRVAATDGESAMQAASRHGLDGILAECGGNAMCATCHVYVEEIWLARLPSMGGDEDALLDGAAAERKPNSRLSCQIKLTAEINGLVLHLPERQV
jgi:ferredoxin, 2Fe-2S